MWYRPIQSVASTSSLMSQEMTRWAWPRVSWYVDAVSDERLSDVTRSVSLLARWSPAPAAAAAATAGSSRLDDDEGDVDVDEEEGGEEEEEEEEEEPCTDRLRRLSGPRVKGRPWGLRRRTASRWSRALPPPPSAGDSEAAVASGGAETWAGPAVAAAMATGGGRARRGEARPTGDEEVK